MYIRGLHSFQIFSNCILHIFKFGLSWERNLLSLRSLLLIPSFLSVAMNQYNSITMAYTISRYRQRTAVRKVVAEQQTGALMCVWGTSSRCRRRAAAPVN